MQADWPEYVRLHEPMSRHTSLKIGGPADLFAEPQNETQLCELLCLAERYAAPVTLIGGGTNLLVLEGGIEGLVIDPRGIHRQIEPLTTAPDGQVTLQVGAGVTTVALVNYCVKNALGGAHVLAGVPGSIGGAIVMNAGGHEGEIQSCVRTIRLVGTHGAFECTAQQAGFSYRASRLPQGAVVVSTVMTLAPYPEVAHFVKQHMLRRRATQPLDWPNAGSFFKNPPGDYAGRLIEGCGLKGYQVGGAQVSDLHANFLVKSKSHPATSLDFMTLIQHVRRQVFQRFGVHLELEVKVIGRMAPEERAIWDEMTLTNHHSIK